MTKEECEAACKRMQDQLDAQAARVEELEHEVCRLLSDSDKTI